MREQKFNHILLWMPNWLGDAIMALPAIQGVRARYPDARITAVTRQPCNEILSLHPAFDSVIKIPFRKSSGIVSQLSFARGLRKYQFDVAIVFPNSFRSALLTCLTDALVRVGYNRDNRGLFLTDPIVTNDKANAGHGIDYYNKLVSCLGVEDPGKKLTPLVFPEGDKPGENKGCLSRH